MKQKQYVCTRWEGTDQYSHVILAKDMEEAQELAKSSGMLVEGELVAEVPSGAGWLVKAVVWLRNKLR